MSAGQQDHSFEFEGQRYTLEIDFAAIAAFEAKSGISVVLLVVEMQGVPKISHVVWLLQAALQKHHPGITEQHCLRMLADNDVKAQLDIALDIAMPPAGSEGDDGAGE